MDFHYVAGLYKDAAQLKYAYLQKKIIILGKAYKQPNKSNHEEIAPKGATGLVESPEARCEYPSRGDYSMILDSHDYIRASEVGSTNKISIGSEHNPVFEAGVREGLRRAQASKKSDLKLLSALDSIISDLRFLLEDAENLRDEAEEAPLPFIIDRGEVVA